MVADSVNPLLQQQLLAQLQLMQQQHAMQQHAANASAAGFLPHANVQSPVTTAQHQWLQWQQQQARAYVHVHVVLGFSLPLRE